MHCEMGPMERPESVLRGSEIWEDSSRKETKEQGGHRMQVYRYEAEGVFSRVPRMAARIDPVLSKLDQLVNGI